MQVYGKESRFELYLRKSRDGDENYLCDCATAKMERLKDELGEPHGGGFLIYENTGAASVLRADVPRRRHEPVSAPCLKLLRKRVLVKNTSPLRSLATLLVIGVNLNQTWQKFVDEKNASTEKWLQSGEFGHLDIKRTENFPISVVLNSAAKIARLPGLIAPCLFGTPFRIWSPLKPGEVAIYAILSGIIVFVKLFAIVTLAMWGAIALPWNYRARKIREGGRE